jgi:hypothetical protein
MSYRLSLPLVSFFRPKASQLSDFGRPRASPCNDTPDEGEITTARLKFKSRFEADYGAVIAEFGPICPTNHGGTVQGELVQLNRYPLQIDLDSAD